MAADLRVTVVVLTHNRARELERCLEHLRQLPEQPHIIVVDSGSTDGSIARLAPAFTGVDWVRCEKNLGAAARNEGVARVRTPFVAFCDDDTWWAPGALRLAADLLQAHPRLALINAQVLVGSAGRPDPRCELMARSPLDAHGLPGPALLGFMAGAVVMRSAAYREAGGYEARLFLGGEEALLGLDLSVRDWRMAYVKDVVAHHAPSPVRDPQQRRILLARNRFWIAWLRLPWRSAWSESRAVWREACAQKLLGPALAAALRGLPWVLRNRRPLPPEVHEMHQRLHGEPGRAERIAADRYRRPRRVRAMERWETSDF